MDTKGYKKVLKNDLRLIEEARASSSRLRELGYDTSSVETSIRTKESKINNALREMFITEQYNKWI